MKTFSMSKNVTTHDLYINFMLFTVDSPQFQTSETTSLVYNKIIVCITYQEVLFNIKNVI